MELRPTTAGDLPALHATFVDAISTVFAPCGFDAPSPPLEVFSTVAASEATRTRTSSRAATSARSPG